MNNSYFRLIAFTLFSFCVTQTLSAQRGLTTLSGKVVDSKTGEGLPGVNLVLEGTSAGTITDDFGNFNYQTRIKNERLKVTFVGYGTQTIKIVFGEYNNLTINLVEGNTELKEVVVKVEKYKNKGNPAVELIRRVIAHKEQNHKSGLDYYSYTAGRCRPSLAGFRRPLFFQTPVELTRPSDGGQESPDAPLRHPSVRGYCLFSVC